MSDNEKKLKTLKDIIEEKMIANTYENGVYDGTHEDVIVAKGDDLQDAAREWIKEIETLPDYGFDNKSCLGFMIEDIRKTSPEYYGNSNFMTDWADSEGQGPSLKEVMIFWIKHFFSLKV